MECRSEFAVAFGAGSCECDGYILAVTKNAVTNSAVMLAVWLVSGFRISPAAGSCEAQTTNRLSKTGVSAAEPSSPTNC